MTVRRLVALGLAVAVAPLVACSVPREADLASAPGVAAGGGRSPAVTATPSASGPTPTPSMSASPSPLPSPRPSPVRPPVPPSVKGYALTTAPRSTPNPLAGVRGATDVFGATTVRSVTKGGMPVGMLFLFAVRPQSLTDPGVTSAVVSRLTTSITRGGVPLKRQRFGKYTVCAGSSAKNGTIVLWYGHGVLTVVVGGDPALVTGYAQALVKAR